jgi:hypothetical protein
VAGLVLVVMGFMATLSLIYTLYTVSWRRSRDPKPAPLPITAAVDRRVPPLELAGLGYLPPETAAVAVLRLAEAQRTPAGKDFLRRFRLGTMPISLPELDSWTGLTTDEIDHVVLGLTLDQRLLPPILLVVQARQPIDQARVRANLKAEIPSDVGGKKVYQFTPRTKGKLSLQALLWFPAPDTLVVCLSREDLKNVPDHPVSEAKQLSGPLREVLRDRVDAGAHAYLAGHVEKWDGLLTLLSPFLTKENSETLSRVRAFGFWLQFEPGVRWGGAVRCVDEGATRALEESWARLRIPEGVAEEDRPIFRELAESYTHEVQEGWLTLRAEAKAR